MADEKIGSGDLHAGLTNRSAKAPDERPQGKSVDDDATRSSTAPSPKPLGPRAT